MSYILSFRFLCFFFYFFPLYIKISIVLYCVLCCVVLSGVVWNGVARCGVDFVCIYFCWMIVRAFMPYAIYKAIHKLCIG